LVVSYSVWSPRNFGFEVFCFHSFKKINFSVEEKQEQFSLLMNYQSSRISSNIGEGNKGKLSLKNFSNSQYVGRVGIGSPPQYLDVILDTGSANFWVNSKLCHDYACETHNSYDNKLSETYENLGYVINVQFGTGEIRGEINYESVTVAGITLSHQSFGEITDEIGEVFVQGKFSGILGLAFPKMAAFNFDPIFDTMIKSDKLENNLFTFYYSDDDNSEVSFGKIDYSKFIG
jgi:Eukaryotic aspartyl protease.